MTWNQRHPLLRALGARIPLGQPFGVPVELHILAVVLTVGMGLWEWSRVGCSFAEASVHASIFFVLLYLVVWTHEMGHVAAGWRYNVPTSKITLWPLGGLAHLSEPAPGPKQDIVISLAGPATHLVWLAVATPLWLLVPRSAGAVDGWLFSPLTQAVDALFFLNVALGCFNLLPFFPMDGGRVLIGLLTLRRGERTAMQIGATVGLVGAALLAIAGLWVGSWHGGLLLALGITGAMACWQLRRAARQGAHLYAARSREAWEGDADAWKRGGAAQGIRSTEAKEARRERRRLEKAQAKLLQDQSQAQDDASEVDRLLDRVSEVGLAGLSRKERARLDLLSKKRRGRS